MDLTGRLLAETTTGDPTAANNTTATNHYSDGGDSPAWIGTSDGATTRNVTGLAGDLAAIISTDPTGANSTALQLVNLHGDVVGTADNTSAATSTTSQYEYTEYGAPRHNNTTPSRYGWLGGKQRSSDALGGVVLMGARLYNPSSGRFLSVDPVAGGSANDYDYTNQDPVNNFDLDGRRLDPSESHQYLHSRDPGNPPHYWYQSVATWVGHHKMDIAGVALSFVPVAGEIEWAYRGYRVARALRSFRRISVAARRYKNARGVGLDFYRGGQRRVFSVHWHHFKLKKWSRSRNRFHYHRGYRGPGGGIGRHRPYQGW